MNWNEFLTSHELDLSFEDFQQNNFYYEPEINAMQ